MSTRGGEQYQERRILANIRDGKYSCYGTGLANTHVAGTGQACDSVKLLRAFGIFSRIFPLRTQVLDVVMNVATKLHGAHRVLVTCNNYIQIRKSHFRGLLRFEL